MGDVMYLRLTSINNAHSIYWKDSKNFADGKSHHMLDCTFANAPGDFGSIQLFGPAGPFTFLLTNATFVGGPVGYAAVSAGQNCGRVGAGGPCNVQYALQDIDWSGLDATAQRIKFGVHSVHAGYVLPIFLSPDDSLGGYRSMVSKHLQGFEQVSDCTPVDNMWDGAHACQREIRRLNVWSANFGVLKLSGPGYLSETKNSDPPVNGMDAGRMYYETMEGFAEMGYGAPVVSGESYTVSAEAWSGDAAFELSDMRLDTIMGSDATLDLTIKGVQHCTLHGGDDRRWLSSKGPDMLGAGLPLPCKIVMPAPASSAVATGLSGMVVEIKSRVGLCLDSPDYSRDGGILQMSKCDGARASQQWIFQVSSGLIGVANGNCLDAPHRSTKAAKVHMWQCDANNHNQQWSYDAKTGQLKSRDGICLDAYEADVEYGAVYMWTCDVTNVNQ